MCDIATRYQNVFGRFAAMDANVDKILRSGGKIPIQRYEIMDSMMNSMDPQTRPISTNVMNAMVDDFNNICERQLSSQVTNSVSQVATNKIMLDALNKELRETLANPNFDIAIEQEKVNSLMDEIKRLSMMM